MTDLGDTTQSNGRNDKLPKRNWEATYKERWFDLKFSHFVEIILTGALVGIAYFQYTVYTRQAGIMQTQANISADQNKISTSVQRAFVTVSAFDMPVRFGTGFAKDRKYWWFIPNIKNNGNTPTKNMRYFIAATCPPELDIGMGGNMGLSCNFMGPPQAEDPEVLMKDQTFKGKTHAALLGPQSVLPLGGVGVTEGSIQRIKDGFPIFEEGIVYYNDIFPGSDLHTTKICFQLTASISDKNEIQTSYGQCAHWNCADEECKTDREEYDKQVASGEIKPPVWTPPPGAKKFEMPIPVVPAPDPK